jgi:hypothetical protein
LFNYSILAETNSWLDSNECEQVQGDIVLRGHIPREGQSVAMSAPESGHNQTTAWGCRRLSYVGLAGSGIRALDDGDNSGSPVIGSHDHGYGVGHRDQGVT